MSVVVETPVAPVIAPAPEILILGEDKNLSYPVPKVSALNTLLAMVFTLLKLIPLMVLVPEVAVPVKDIF